MDYENLTPEEFKDLLSNVILLLWFVAVLIGFFLGKGDITDE